MYFQIAQLETKLWLRAQLGVRAALTAVARAAKLSALLSRPATAIKSKPGAVGSGGRRLQRPWTLLVAHTASDPEGLPQPASIKVATGTSLERLGQPTASNASAE